MSEIEIKKAINRQESEKIKKASCKKDRDCGTDEVCAFNENDEKHYCISNKLYVGCLKSKDKMKSSVSSIQENDTKDIQSCFQFARKLNNPEILYDYITYQPKKETSIQKSSIEVDLKCGDMKLVNFPYEENMTESCDVLNENCTLTPNKSMMSILKNNQSTCQKDYHLNVSYQCNVENRKKNIKIPIGKNPMEIKLTCPVDQGEDSKYKAKCTAYTLGDMDQVDLTSSFDAHKSQEQCATHASFLVPNIIQDIGAYKMKRDEKLNTSIQKFSNIINADEEDLAKKKALQYMLDYEQKYHQKISYADALKHVKSIFEHASNETTASSESWNKTTGLNKIPFPISSSIYDTLTILGTNKTYTSYEEVLADSTIMTQRQNGDIIIYFAKNDSAIPPSKQGKAYITTYDFLITQNKFSPDSWETVANCITLISTSSTSENKRSAYLSSLATSTIHELEEDLEVSLHKLNEIQDFESAQLEDKTNEIDKTINLITQRIKTSNYQSEMNKKIIRYVYILLILVFIITVAYFVYSKSSLNSFY